jgi:hypothetical protein
MYKSMKDFTCPLYNILDSSKLKKEIRLDYIKENKSIGLEAREKKWRISSNDLGWISFGQR